MTPNHKICDLCHTEMPHKTFSIEFDLKIISNMDSQNPLYAIGQGHQWSEVEVKDVCNSCLAEIGKDIVKAFKRLNK